MTNRTFNIIMACKQWNKNDIVENVKVYMSKECDVPITEYTQCQISDIMMEAMYDYIDSCDKPSSFLREIEYNRNYYGITVSIGEIIAMSFKNTMVLDRNGNYINGFGEWMK